MLNLIRLWRAFWYSMDGFKVAWKEEPAFRDEIVLAVVLFPAACFLAPDAISFILMVGSLLAVIALELVNTAVEATVNRIGLHRDPLAKKAKDTASAAVLVALINLVITWIAILL